MSDSDSPAAAVPPRRGWRRWKYLGWFLFLGAGLVYFYLLDGWRDVTDGRLRGKAQATFSYFDTNDLTEVRIYLLLGVPGKATGDQFEGGDGKSSIYGSITLTGKDLEDFLSIWHTQMINDAMSGLCHDPAYGFRLYKGNRMVTETSLCWACENFSVKVWPFEEPRLYGFDARGKAGQELLAFCDRRLPYYRRPPPVPMVIPQRNRGKGGALEVPAKKPERWPY